MRRVFVPFLEEIEDSKKAYQNYLTFNEVYILGHVLSTKYALKYKLHYQKHGMKKNS